MKLVINFLLFLIAVILFPLLTPLNVVIVTIQKKSIKAMSGYFLDTARRIDVYGCGEFRALLNLVFITKNGITFKSDGHTISHFLGVNQLAGSLSVFGRMFTKFLSLLDKNHCVRAIDNSF